MSIKKNIFAPSTTGRGAMRRAAMLLLVTLLTVRCRGGLPFFTAFSTVRVKAGTTL